MKKKTSIKLIVTDIDNTIFDWVSYYSYSMVALFEKVETIINVPKAKLAEEARDIFTRHCSIEYPFVIQDMASVIAFYGSDIDKMLTEAVEPGRKAFLKRSENLLVPYPDVEETLKTIKKKYPDLPMVALTDAPRYIAMWKLNKLKVLPYFSAVYGLPDPRIPTDPDLGRVKVSPQILLKHLQQYDFGFKGKIRILPEEYEKPGTRGLKTVLMDNDLDEPAEKRSQVLWIGDNLRKDIGLGQRVGVKSAWASYGTHLDPEVMKILHTFSPIDNIHKNVSLPSNASTTPTPDIVLKQFSDILGFLEN